MIYGICLTYFTWHNTFYFMLLQIFAYSCSHSEGCLVLFMVSFAEWNLLTRYDFIIFIFITLGGGSRKTLLQFMSVSPCVFFQDFYSVQLYIQLYSESIFFFLYDVMECSNFIFLHVAVQFSQNHLWKKLCFLHYIFLPSPSEMRWSLVYGFIAGLSVSSFTLYFCFCASTILFLHFAY